MEKMQKLNLRMQKLNFPGTHWRGLVLIGAQKKPAAVTTITDWGVLLPHIWIHIYLEVKSC